MIESLFNPIEVKEKGTKRLEIFIAGMIFTLIGALFAINVVPPTPEAQGLGFLVVAFISIPAAPFFVQIFKIEEEEEIVEKHKSIIFRHIDVIEIFAFFFLAVVVASSLFYIIAPPEISQPVFNDQVNDLVSKRVISGNLIGSSASTGTSHVPDFWTLFNNNIVVLVLSFTFSLVLGAGAVFLISWNASIIGVLIGKIAENPEAFGSLSTGNIFTNYLIALPVTLLRLLPHGIFEIGAYFIGAVAGGVLSAGIIHESIRHRKTEFHHLRMVLTDSLFYLGVSVIFLFIGAVIECFLI